jgi:hypothetical protein
MANVLGPYDPISYAQTALMHLKKTLGFGARVYRGYDKAPAEKGSVITLRRPQSYAATAMPATATPLAPETVQISLTEHWGVTIELTDKEFAYTKEQIIEEQISPMSYAVSNKIDQLLNGLYKFVPWSNQVASTLAVADITAARKVLSTNGVPMNDGRISLALSPTLMKEALDLAAFTQHQGSGQQGADAQQSGVLGPRYGMSPFENQNAPTHTSGVSADATGALTANADVGATSIAIDSVTSGGTFKAGDHLLIAGDPQRYAITANVTATGGAATLSISPALKVAAPSTTVVTITLDGAGTGKEVSLAFHRDAFALAMAVLPDNLPGIQVFSARDEQAGLSLRVRRWTDGNNAKQYLGVDALFGVACLNGNLAVRMYDN